jgi:hypothetical protein
MADIFISYVEENSCLAIDLAHTLESLGLSTWYYERDTVPGRSYLLQIGEAIDVCKAVMLLISSHSLSSHQVTQEVIQAYEKQKPFLPLLIDLSHEELQMRQPEWRAALGATACIRIPPGGIQRLIPQLKKGISVLETPSASHATVSPTSADEHRHTASLRVETSEKQRSIMRAVVSLKLCTIILAMTLGVWTFFYVMTPSAPLTSGETVVVSGGCTAVVLCMRRIWRHMHTHRAR